MKRVFFCGFASALIAACTTAQIDQAQQSLGAVGADVTALAPLVGAFGPLDASAPVTASAPGAASGATK